MSIQDRKLRHQKELKQHILKIARKLATKGGWGSVTMRKISDEIEYSLPVIYKHFTSKEDILAEIAKEGFEMLSTYLNTAREQGKDAKEKALLIAQSYVGFSIEHPQLYQVMFNLEGVIFYNQNVLGEAEKMFEFVKQNVEQIITDLDAKIEDTHRTAEVVWAALHGIAALCMIERIYDGKQKYKELVNELMQAFMTSWGVK